jgi:hypothetical protein
MRKFLFPGIASALFALAIVSCKKSVNSSTDVTLLTDNEKALIASAGFNRNWAEKTKDGNFLVEGDILLTTAQLKEMAGVAPLYNFIVANEEHYRTYNLVTTPASGARTITVRLGDGFPSFYSTGLDNALARYNSYGLKIKFQRVSTGGDIVIGAADLGMSGPNCILGQSAGFPTNGNPAPGFTLSNSNCAVELTNTADKADEVMAHEIGHCIGFRHTDYKNRASCGDGREKAGTIGAVYIPGTPTTVNAAYNSWMMACTNDNPGFSASDGVALNYVY